MSKTIIHVTQSLGGVETYLRLFLDHGAFDGFGKCILVVPERSSLADAWEQRGGVVEVLPMVRTVSPLKDFRAALKLQTLFRKNSGALVHLHSSKAGVLGRLAALFVSRKSRPAGVIYTPHAFYYLALSGIRRRIFLAVERLLVPLTGCVLATSTCEARRAEVEVGFNPGKVHCVPNAVEVGAVRPKHPPQKRFEVIFVGRICYQKNVELFIEVVKRFRDEPGIHFTLVGAGHYADDRARIQSFLRTEQIQQALLSIVDWMPRENLLDFYAQSDLCILTSRYESFGYVVAEANAAGTPAVASDVDGVRDIILNGISGITVQDGNANSFSSAINLLRKNPERLAKMGEQARARVERLFSIKRNAQILADFYEDVLLRLR